MSKIKISEFTIDKIKNREFEKIIPELYELENIVENSDWHINDDVLHHTISVLIELEKLLEETNDKIKCYLDQIIAKHSRKEILFLGATFHNLGKKETFLKEDNITKCPEHEEKGAEKLKKTIKRFDLPSKEEEIVIQIVKNHGVIHSILDAPEDAKKQLEKLKQKYSNIFLEMVLLAMADMLGSQLRDNKPGEFEFRKDFLSKILNNY